MLQNKSSERLKRFRALASLSALILIFGVLIFLNSLESAATFKTKEIGGLVLIGENSLLAISEPCYITQRDRAIELLLEEIIKRESGGDPNVVNKKYGYKSGMGLCQIIPKTWNSTLKRMKENIEMDDYCWQNVDANFSEEHPIFNPTCHLIVCKWLLETDGIRHWDSDGEWWGSGPYLKLLLELGLCDLNPGSKVKTN